MPLHGMHHTSIVVMSQLATTNELCTKLTPSKEQLNHTACQPPPDHMRETHVDPGVMAGRDLARPVEASASLWFWSSTNLAGPLENPHSETSSTYIDVVEMCHLVIRKLMIYERQTRGQAGGCKAILFSSPVVPTSIVPQLLLSSPIRPSRFTMARRNTPKTSGQRVPTTAKALGISASQRPSADISTANKQTTNHHDHALTADFDSFHRTRQRHLSRPHLPSSGEEGSERSE
ncbi:hypothetical protein DFH07DRAFT_1023145 [Mycena maculata]|uniref:Uncharacterized protein n=1 Tax=Mycena maculata TaxID=230809 RepID=A0AAD7JB86_9AGAR|nr:hypothetical protein DFH07DRAFT_1023145 [Mycena maculata]